MFVFDVMERRETNVFDAAKCGMLGLGRAKATGHKRPEDLAWHLIWYFPYSYGVE